MKFIHTSDWHLGKKLYGRMRYEETGCFLDWLAGVINDEKADALIVAGDIFDTASPPNRALEQYYAFLHKVCIGSPSCRDIIIIAGNHDSPSLLAAPKGILKAMNIHISAYSRPIDDSDISDEIVQIKDNDGNLQAVVCAVPYLREKDVRSSCAGESQEEKVKNLLTGIREHYSKVLNAAEELKVSVSGKSGRIPIIACGHLFAAGGITVEGDGVREAYVGNLERVSTDVFEGFDYAALGHLHVPQSSGGKETVLYSGSPIPVGFGEGEQQKRVLSVSFDITDGSAVPEIRSIPVPSFCRLASIRGGIDDIANGIAGLGMSGRKCFAEIIYTGDACGQIPAASLAREVEKLCGDVQNVEILRIKNESVTVSGVCSANSGETLCDLNETDVFERCMDSYKVTDDERNILRDAYADVLRELREGDGENEDS